MIKMDHKDCEIIYDKYVKELKYLGCKEYPEFYKKQVKHTIEILEKML